jgi:hypothetical protein
LKRQPELCSAPLLRRFVPDILRRRMVSFSLDFARQEFAPCFIDATP